jgi:hypothetical protein
MFILDAIYATNAHFTVSQDSEEYISIICENKHINISNISLHYQSVPPVTIKYTLIPEKLSSFSWP